MYMPKRTYETTGQALRHVPEDLARIRIKCPNPECATSFPPDWLKKIPPIHPVKPNVGPGVWVPAAKEVECPKFRKSLMFPLPIEEQKAEYSFFGDEAYRSIEDLELLTYSLVGTNSVRLAEVEEVVRAFKAELCPSESPDSWHLHMKKIWPEHARRRHPIFKEWDQDFVKDFARRFFALVKNFDEAFVVHNITAIYHKSRGIKQRKIEKREVRQEAYSLLLMKIIGDCTKIGIKPYFTFDSEKDSEADRVIHGWARDAFHGSRINLLFGYLARGIEIPEPVFVSPASRPCLEVADFVSYVIARYCYRRIKGQPIDLDPKHLGPVVYLAFDPSGDLLFSRNTGYPWRSFYGNAEA